MKYYWIHVVYRKDNFEKIYQLFNIFSSLIFWIDWELLVIINDEKNEILNIKNKKNIKHLMHDNTNAEFGAWFKGLQQIEGPINQVILSNCSFFYNHPYRFLSCLILMGIVVNSMMNKPYALGAAEKTQYSDLTSVMLPTFWVAIPGNVVSGLQLKLESEIKRFKIEFNKYYILKSDYPKFDAFVNSWLLGTNEKLKWHKNFKDHRLEPSVYESKALMIVYEHLLSKLLLCEVGHLSSITRYKLVRYTYIILLRIFVNKAR